MFIPIRDVELAQGSPSSRSGCQRRSVHLDRPHQGFGCFGVTDQPAGIARHICQQRPQQFVSQPQAIGLPPSMNLSRYQSICSWESQRMKNEKARLR